MTMLLKILIISFQGLNFYDTQMRYSRSGEVTRCSKLLYIEYLWQRMQKVLMNCKKTNSPNPKYLKPKTMAVIMKKKNILIIICENMLSWHFSLKVQQPNTMNLSSCWRFFTSGEFLFWSQVQVGEQNPFFFNLE